MAHIRKRGNSWQIVVELPRAGGRRKRVTKTVQGKKSDAEMALAELQQELMKRNFNYVKPERITVADLLHRYLRTKNDIRLRTYERYQDIVERHLIPNLSDYYITEVTPHLILDYYDYALLEGRLDGKEGGLSPTTVRQYHIILNGAFQYAVDHRILTYSPMASVKPPKKDQKEIKTLTAGEIGVLLNYLEETDSVIYIPAYIAAVTGMRLSEVLGLKWRDIDLKKGTVSVSRTLQQSKKKIYFSDVKSKHSKRLIYITQKDAAVLKQHKKNQARNKLMLGPGYNDQGLVCAGLDGRPLKPFTVSSRFRRVARKLNFEVSFHGLRHSHATILLAEGALPRFVSSRLGHFNTAFTQDTYGHVTPQDDQNITEMFGRILDAE